MKSCRVPALLVSLLVAFCDKSAQARVAAADQVVDYVFTVQGIDASRSAMLYLCDGGLSESEYLECVASASNFASYSWPISSVGDDGTVSFNERYAKTYVPSELNNFYYQIVLDNSERMVGRLGESSDFTITDLGTHEGVSGSPNHFYDVSATLNFKSGYIAPYHTGPDNIPEPTGGLLCLVGAALLALRRKV